MGMNHVHLMAPEVQATGFFEQYSVLRRASGDAGFEVPVPAREHACSFHVNAPGGYLVEVGA